MPEKATTFPRRRFLHLAVSSAVLFAAPKTLRSQSFPTRIGDLIIDPETCGVTVNEREYLTSKQYKLLKLLWLNKGQTVRRELMLKHLYSGIDEPEPQIMDVFIATLRFKILKATDGKGAIKIDAVADCGYLLRETS